MKKIKSFFCVILLSTCLVANVFAGDTGGSGFFGFFDDLMKTVVSMLRSADDDCKPRQCTNCKAEDRDENGNCRPPTN